MKTLKQIRENFNDNILNQVDDLPDELMLENSLESPRTKGGSLLQSKGIPSAKEMPVMLVFRRVQYRVFPNKQVVALYYSSMVDKYLSIPFGPGRNLNISEATIVDNLDEDWQDVNRKDKTDGLSQKAVNAYRRENPGSKLQTAVTEKNPSGKRAARRKSFCSRMGGMKKRLTSAKTARDPDSRINKALRRWNCEEDFNLKLNELRDQQNEGIGDTIEKGRKYLQNKLKDSPTFKAAQELGHKLPGYENVKAAKEKFGKGDYLGAAGETAKSLGKAAATGAAVAGAVGSALLGGETKNPTYGGFKRPVGSAKKSTSWGKSKGYADATSMSKLRSAELASADAAKKQASVHENKIVDIKKMIKEGIDSMDLPINGRTITLNTSMAKRILEVYDSVNTKNKKIVEGMLNEDLESFKKLLNFSIRK